MKKFNPDIWNSLVAETLVRGRATLWKRDLQGINPTSPGESGFLKHSVGSYRGQVADYRASIEGSLRGVHLVEYHDRYEAHVDSMDPHKKPVEHLVIDSALPALGKILFVFGLSILGGKRGKYPRIPGRRS
ncbi:MAG: hypothetical protein ACYDAZ_00100 [Thermoplasmataceae archaeon]